MKIYIRRPHMKNFRTASYLTFGALTLALVFAAGLLFQRSDVAAQLTDRISASNNFYDDWEGRKVAWYGDSLTELYYHCDMVNQYFNFDGYNCGIRGAAVSNVNDSSIDLWREERLHQSGIEIPDDVEEIIIMAGTNDWCASVELGDKKLTFDGSGEPDVDVNTFYGAAHMMFYNISRSYPDAYVLVAGTPIVASNTYNLYNQIGLTAFDYGDALCEAASMWGYQSFNISEMMGINVNNIEDMDGEMYEGIHFTEGAARKAANVIIQEISSRRYY
jgi:hypothetical protein